MDQEAKIKEALLPLLKEAGVSLYDITWNHEGKHQILTIAIEKSEGNMDVDTCATVAELISTKLDEINVIEHEYMLEVCSPGAERRLRNAQDITQAVGEYIYAKFKKPVGKMKEVKGTLLSFENNVLCIEYMDKTFRRQLSVEMDACSLIRLAVKI